MKKMVLTFAAVLMSLIASANFTNASLASFNTNFYFSPITTVDTTIVSNTAEEIKLEQTLSCVALYDINHIVINNDKKKYIRIENANGKVITETHNSVDIALEPGNYYVYTSCNNIVTKYYK